MVVAFILKNVTEHEIVKLNTSKMWEMPRSLNILPLKYMIFAVHNINKIIINPK